MPLEMKIRMRDRRGRVQAVSNIQWWTINSWINDGPSPNHTHTQERADSSPGCPDERRMCLGSERVGLYVTWQEWPDDIGVRVGLWSWWSSNNEKGPDFASLNPGHWLWFGSSHWPLYWVWPMMMSKKSCLQLQPQAVIWSICSPNHWASETSLFDLNACSYS